MGGVPGGRIAQKGRPDRAQEPLGERGADEAGQQPVEGLQQAGTGGGRIDCPLLRERAAQGREVHAGGDAFCQGWQPGVARPGQVHRSLVERGHTAAADDGHQHLLDALESRDHGIGHVLGRRTG